MNNIDLIIVNGTLCTMNKDRDVRDYSAIAVHDGKIIDICASNAIHHKYVSDSTIDATNCIVMPGLINTHTHSSLTFLRGISDDLNLMDWLTRYIWPLEESFINEEFVYHATRLAIYEMVLSGTTTFNDSYFFSREVAKAAKNMGVRCIAGELIFDNSPIRKNPIDTLSYIEENLQEWKGDELVKASLAPHSLYACSPKTIKMAHNLASKYDALINIFVSESDKEIQTIGKTFGKSPVEVLGDLGLLTRNLVATHCVYLTDRDMDLLVTNQVGISHNPESNMKLGNGIAPIAKLLKRGAIVGIGTDGAASNNDLSLLSEIDFATKLQKGYLRDSTVMNSLQAVEMLTVEGAKVLNLSDKIGSIEIGKQADIIILDLHKAHLTPMYNPYSHIVYAANSSDVKSVIINGKIVVQDRIVLGQSFTEIREKAISYCSEIKDFLKLQPINC